MPEKKPFLLFIFSMLIHTVIYAQTVTGSWYGIGYVQVDGTTDSYMSELILKQDGERVRGEFNYYFRDSLFKNKIVASYNKKTRLLTISKLPVIYYRSTSTKKGIETLMFGAFELRVSKTVSVLNGSLNSYPEYHYSIPVISYRFKKNTDPGNDIPDSKKWAMTDEDASDPDSTITAVAKPAPRNILPTKQTPPSTQTIKTDAGKIPVIAKKENTINSYTKSAPFVTAIDSSTIIQKQELFVARKKDYVKEIELDNSKILVEVYDNGTIDYDSVSLFLNTKQVLPKTMLNHRSVKITLQLNEELEYNELGMFAENLGMIPPNTAAMIIHDGKKQYEILLNSDFNKNAIIKLTTKKANKKG